MASINKNGLWASDTVNSTGSEKSNFFLRVNNESGDVNIEGDFSVEGDMAVVGDSTLPVIRALDVSQNPVYIKNPYNLAFISVAEQALVVEGGTLRTDISQAGVGIATYKPLTRGTVDMGPGENVGALAFFGKDLDNNDVRYASVRGVATDPRTNTRKGRLNFLVQDATVHEPALQIDASYNSIMALVTPTFTYNFCQSDGVSKFYRIYPQLATINTAEAITKQTTATLMPGQALTVQTGMSGYYSYSAQVTLNGVAGNDNASSLQIYADISGGSATPIAGSNSISPIRHNAANVASIIVTGALMQRLTSGQIVRMLHLENGPFTFSSATVQVMWNYLGDQTAGQNLEG